MIGPRRIRWAGQVAREWKPEVKRPLVRPRRMSVDNVKMDLGEVGWGDVDWIGLAKDRNRWRALVNVYSRGMHPNKENRKEEYYKKLPQCVTYREDSYRFIYNPYLF
jgi:hypothetical protein